MVNIRGDDDALPEEILAGMTEQEQTEISLMQRNPRIYADLACSLAPGVYGHEDVKRAVLLMLLGGVHKTTSEVIAAYHSYPPCATYALYSSVCFLDLLFTKWGWRGCQTFVCFSLSTVSDSECGSLP